MSFTSAIDLLRHSKEDIQRHLSSSVCGCVCGGGQCSVNSHKTDHNNFNPVQGTGQFVDSIAQSLCSLQETNAFMLMTINRCIDYAKAVKGLQLVPSLQAVSLREAIDVPLSCTRNIQQRVDVLLTTLSPAVATAEVVTDKQWLQENLLCLLSNAVKYSSAGTVTLTVELMSSPRNPHQQHRQQQMVTVREKEEEQQLLNYPQLVFEVEDCGIGVAAEDVDMLFRPFKQTQRLAGGTGLGLYSLVNDFLCDLTNGLRIFTVCCVVVNRQKDKKPSVVVSESVPGKMATPAVSFGFRSLSPSTTITHIINIIFVSIMMMKTKKMKTKTK
jgi:signal transduction histidine kinase